MPEQTALSGTPASISASDEPQTVAGGRIVETAKEARGGERGPSMVVVLALSTICVAVIFMGLWYFMAL